ncbi:MAG TPA: hypothetical protein PKX41_11960 [Anaerolineaceae bacterium]|mgnify:CR=1 FL=1|nr:hypothetical protein [Anaerolineaceae bacterium]
MEKIEETLVLETNVENLFNLILSYWQDVQANYYKNYEPNITEKGTYNYGLTNIGGRPERKNNQLVIMGHTSFCPVNEDIEKMLARYEVVVFEAITLNVEKIKLIGKCIVPENMNYYRLFFDIWNRIKMDFGLPIESPEPQKEVPEIGESNKYWKLPEGDKQLIGYWRAGLSRSEIARKLNHSKEYVTSRISFLRRLCGKGIVPLDRDRKRY